MKLQTFFEAIAGAGRMASALLLWPLLVPWYRRWGATDEEVKRPLPGDELVPKPQVVYTQAISIRAPAAAVWPWLVQVGQERGGFYSYEGLENLVGCDIHNADRILPEFQQLQVGDGWRLHPRMPPIPIVQVQPERALVLHGAGFIPGGTSDPAARGYLATTWGFYLFDRPDQSTRLLSRWRVGYHPSLANELAWHFMLEPIAEVMQRKMLLGIKERAEAASTA